jgi:formylmethanofuran dehydrogenase subunit E
MKLQDLDSLIQFHGHFCPGLAIGVRAAELALREIGHHSAGHEVVAVVETDMCCVDAIQFLTGCTFGNGNLIHLDYGKNAFTFVRTSDGKAVRLLMKPQPRDDNRSGRNESFSKVKDDTAQNGDRQSAQDLMRQRAQEILDLPLASLFDLQAVEPHIPVRTRVRESFRCEACGEMVMETRLRLIGGRKLCIPCFESGK